MGRGNCEVIKPSSMPVMPNHHTGNQFIVFFADEYFTVPTFTTELNIFEGVVPRSD
jgi:hypothetical protein